MTNEIQRARLYVADYFRPINVELCAGSGALHRNARKVKDILETDRPLTQAQIQAVSLFANQMEVYRETAHRFNDFRPELMSLHETVDRLYGQLREHGLHDYRTSARRGYNTQRSRKLQQNGTIYPYHFKGLSESLDCIAKRGLDIDSQLPKSVNQLEANYWDVFNTIKSERRT